AKAWRWARSRPVAAAALAVVALALLAAGGVAGWWAFLMSNRVKDAKLNAALANEGVEQFRAAKRSSDRRLYAANMRLAQHAWQENATGRLIALLNNARPGRMGD